MPHACIINSRSELIGHKKLGNVRFEKIRMKWKKKVEEKSYRSHLYHYNS